MSMAQDFERIGHVFQSGTEVTPIGELLPMTVPFKRETYAQVIAAFADIAKKSE